MLAFGINHSTPYVCQGTQSGAFFGQRQGRSGIVEGMSGACPDRSRRATSSALPAISEMVGASEETGGVFDPLGLATDEVRAERITNDPSRKIP